MPLYPKIRLLSTLVLFMGKAQNIKAGTPSQRPSRKDAPNTHPDSPRNPERGRQYHYSLPTPESQQEESMEFQPHIRITQREAEFIVKLRLLPPELQGGIYRCMAGMQLTNAEISNYAVALQIVHAHPSEGSAYTDFFRIDLTPEDYKKLFPPPSKKRRRGPATPQAAPPPSPENS